MPIAAILARAVPFARSWWKAALGALVIFPAAFLLGQCSGASNERARQAVREAKAERVDAKAREAAAGERVTDRVKVETAREEQINATQNLPDGAPSPRQRSRVDVILRQQQGAGDAAR